MIFVQFRKEAQTIADNLRESTAYPDLRDMTDSIYGVWYTYVDKYQIAYSCKPILKIIMWLVLTDSDYKSNSAYSMLKDVAREVYSQTNLESGSDIESLSNLNHCRDALTQVLSGNGSENIPKKADKVSKAQDVVE